jgi:hypothetical protein
MGTSKRTVNLPRRPSRARGFESDFPLCKLSCLSGGRHSKSLAGRCKVFFAPVQFSLAIDENKSIFRFKKMSPKTTLLLNRVAAGETSGKNSAGPFLVLTKSRIFDKSQLSFYIVGAV